MSENSKPDYSRLPKELTGGTGWVVWAYENGAKVPRLARDPSKRAFVGTRNKSWATFAESVAAYSDPANNLSGIGKDLTSGICALDADDCVNKNADGTLTIRPDVLTAISQFKTYCEYTPSCFENTEKLGGIRLWFRIDPKQAANLKNISKDAQHELYFRDRYFTVTGRPVEGFPFELQVLDEAGIQQLLSVARGRSAAKPEANIQHSGIVVPTAIPSGQRNDTLFRIGSLFRRFGVDSSVLTSYLLTQNRKLCSPPLSDDEVRQIAGSCSRYQPEPDERLRMTETWAAEQFVLRYGNDVRYCHDQTEWRCWDGKRWAPDKTGGIHRLVKKFVLELYPMANAMLDDDKRQALSKFAVKCESNQHRKNIVALAQNEFEVSVVSTIFDTEPWLLNLQNGTLDLKTGVLREHQREDLISKITPVAFDPEAKAPRWERFLTEIFPNQPDTIAFLQRAAGYTLTGSVIEECFFLLHGDGANGKGTFLQTMEALHGDYADHVDFSIFIQKPHGEGGPRDGKKKLIGKRFIRSSESDPGQRLAEAKVKEITSPDGKFLSAGVLYHDDINFIPTHKLWLASNHDIEIRGTDDGIWRRIRRVNFGRVFEEAERDPKLKSALLNELPGILNWALDGLTAYLSDGKLLSPESVKKATLKYRQDQDQLTRFLAAVRHPETKPADEIQGQALYQAYKAWAASATEFVLSQTKFGTRMKQLLPNTEKRHIVFYQGFRLNNSNYRQGAF